MTHSWRGCHVPYAPPKEGCRLRPCPERPISLATHTRDHQRAGKCWGISVRSEKTSRMVWMLPAKWGLRFCTSFLEGRQACERQCELSRLDEACQSWRTSASFDDVLNLEHSEQNETRLELQSHSEHDNDGPPGCQGQHERMWTFWYVKTFHFIFSLFL